MPLRENSLHGHSTAKLVPNRKVILPTMELEARGNAIKSRLDSCMIYVASLRAKVTPRPRTHHNMKKTITACMYAVVYGSQWLISLLAHRAEAWRFQFGGLKSIARPPLGINAIVWCTSNLCGACFVYPLVAAARTSSSSESLDAIKAEASKHLHTGRLSEAISSAELGLKMLRTLGTKEAAGHCEADGGALNVKARRDLDSVYLSLLLGEVHVGTIELVHGCHGLGRRGLSSKGCTYI